MKDNFSTKLERIVCSTRVRRHFNGIIKSFKYCHGGSPFIADFSTPKVLRQLTEPRSRQSVYPVARECVRSKSDGNQVSADLIASNCARYFINFSRKTRSIDRPRARRRGPRIFPAERLLISRRVTSH